MINYVVGAATAVFVGAALREVTKEVTRDATYLGIYKDRDEMSEEEYNEKVDQRARRNIEQMKRDLGIE
jgi:hypothetical protein